MIPSNTAPELKSTPRKRGRPLGSRRIGEPLNVAERNRQARQSVVARNQQLGWRLGEFAAAIGISLATLWRLIQAEKIRTVKIGGVTLIPRSEAIRLRLIEDTPMVEVRAVPSDEQSR